MGKQSLVIILIKNTFLLITCLKMVESLRRVLLIGEGNFSYALARAKHCPIRLIATSFDSQEELLKKYPESVEILKKLNQLQVKVYHRVDATRI